MQGKEISESPSRGWLVDPSEPAQTSGVAATAQGSALVQPWPLDAAKAALKLGHNDEVVRLCDAVLTVDAGSTTALRLKARALGAQNLNEDAGDIWRQLAGMMPGSPEPHLNIARIARRSGQWPQALAAARLVIAREPGHAEALAIAAQGFIKDATARDGHDIWHGLARTDLERHRDCLLQLEDAQRWEALAAALTALIAAHPDRADLADERLRLAGEMIDRGKSMESWEDYAGASAAYRGGAMLDAGNASEAVRLLGKMTRPLVSAGRERLKARDFATAGRLFGEALLYDPDHIVALTGMARVNDSAAAWPKSLELWSKVVALEPANEAAWLKLAVAATRCEKFDVAVAAFRHATRPENRILVQDGIERASRQALRHARVLMLGDQNVEASRALAVAEAVIPQDESVKTTREKITRSLRHLQQKAYEARDFAQVAALGGEIVIGRPHDAAAWLLYGRALAAVHDHGAAVGAFRKSLELDRGKIDASVGLARALSVLGRHDESQSACIDGLAANPGHAKLLETRDRIAQERNRKIT